MKTARSVQGWQRKPGLARRKARLVRRPKGKPVVYVREV